MTSPDKKLSLLLTGGADNRTFSEFVSPVITQGESPKLRQSVNTRFSRVPGTCTRAPKVTQIATLAGGSDAWGLVPSGAGRNTLRFDGPEQGYSRFIVGDGQADTAMGSGIGATGQEVYLPARISGAGALDPVPCVANIAIGHNSHWGYVVRAYPTITADLLAIYIMVSVWMPDGREIVQPTSLGGFTLSTNVVWIGVTTHGVNHNRVWYHSPNGICYREVYPSGKTLGIGSEVVVVVPGRPVGASMDVVSDGSTHAYLAHSQAGSTTGATLRRVDVTTGATTHSVNFAGALNGGGDCSVMYSPSVKSTSYPSGPARVGVAFSRVTGSTTTVAVYDSTLTVVGAPYEKSGGNGDCCVAFSSDGTNAKLVLCVSSNVGSFATAPGTLLQTTASVFSLDGLGPTWPAISGGHTFPYATLQAQASEWRVGDTVVPLVVLGRHYGNTYATFGDLDYVEDASHELYAMYGTPRAIARYGTLRGNSLPAQTLAHQALARGMFCVSDSVHAVYKKAPINTVSPPLSHGRYVVLDLSAHQPSIAHDKDGACLIAAAMPAQFDGNALAEIGGPLHAPRISLVNTISGGLLPAGVYRFAAVYVWTDNAGVSHRSKPSNVVTHTFNGTTDRAYLYVTPPAGLLDGTMYGGDLAKIAIQTYVSPKNGNTLHLLSELRLSSTQYVYAFSITTEGDLARPQLYTTATAGEEIPGQCAPPLRDIAIIGSRAWGIDAEFPTRWVYSKLRIAGVGYEFAPAFEGHLPSGSGEALAIREWNGMAIILAQHGVWQVAGDGPNNNASAGSFGEPVKLSDIGCSSTASAVCYPGGIMWQSGTRFVKLDGQGIDYVADFDCLYDISAAVLLRRDNEIVFLSSSAAEARVYNYAMRKWSTWDSQTIPDPVDCAALLPWNDDIVLLHSSSTGKSYRLDANTVSTAESMVWDTDWFLLGSDFQDHALVRDLVLNGAIVGPHSVTIEVFVDYEETASTSHTWDEAWLTANAVGGRYTVRLEPVSQNCRAMRIKVYDTVAEDELVRDGMAPRSLTIVYALEAPLYEDAFVQGSRA